VVEVLYNPTARRKCYRFALAAPPSIDTQLLSLLNHPGNPVLDGVMKAASNNGVLLAIAAITAIYLWIKSPHRALAAVLLWISIGAADLLSVRVVKPLVSRSRPCQVDPVHVAVAVVLAADRGLRRQR